MDMLTHGEKTARTRIGQFLDLCSTAGGRLYAVFRGLSDRSTE